MALSELLKRFEIKKNLKRILFQQSHLTPYLPILKQRPMNKYMRIYDDKSVKEAANQNLAANSSKPSQYSRQSYIDPLGSPMLVYYVLVFIAIIFTYTEAWMMYTFGTVAWQDSLSMPGFVFARIYSIVFFSVDVYVQLHAGYLYRGMIIIDSDRIKSRYMRYFFLIDMLLIFSLIISIATQEYYLNYLKIVCFTKFIRMLQLDDLYIRKLSVNIIGKTMYVIGKQFITIFILSHTIGVIFYLIDFALVNDDIQGIICQGNNSLCWLYSATAYNGIINYNWPLQYFYALYWGVNTITTISYGDIAPNNPYETIFALYMFCFGFVVMGYIVNNIIKIILWATLTKNEYRDQLILYNTYMDSLQIPRTVQYQIKQYLYNKYMKQSNRNLLLQNQMQAKLPIQLRIQLFKSIYFEMNNYFQCIFQNCPTTTQFLFNVQQKKYIKNDIVLLQGSSLNKMFYILKGQVSLSINFQQNSQKITSIKTRDEFISLYEFFLNEKAKFNIIVDQQSVFYYIDKNQIQEILSRYPDLNQKYKLTQYQLLIKKSYKLIFYRCFYCRGDHHWYECPDNFPIFKYVYLNKTKQKKEKQRIYQHNYKTLKSVDKMKLLKRSDDVIIKIKQRIVYLRKLRQIQRGYFDVDMNYNWPNYDTKFNIAQLMKDWNNRIYNKATSYQYIDARFKEDARRRSSRI